MKKLFRIFALTIVIAVSLTSCAFSAPRPEVKEGKFDFSVTYEVDGKQETVSGVFVCKFAGTGFALDGAYREWESYIEDDALSARLEATRGYLLLKTTADGEIYLDLNLSAKYFMADPHYHNLDANDEERGAGPRLFMEYSDAKYEEIAETYSEDPAVLASYGVKVIRFTYDEPIENEYGLFNF